MLVVKICLHVFICRRGRRRPGAAPGYQPHVEIRRHKHKHILVLLRICLVRFYYPQEESSVDWHSRRGKIMNVWAAPSLAHFPNCCSLCRSQVRAQVYEAHEGARLQREECVWCSPHNSRPALWFSTPSVFTAGARSPQNTLSGSGGEMFYKAEEQP